MHKKKRILLLFPDEWDLAMIEEPGIAERYRFDCAGFDLFRFPDNANLFTYQVERFVDRLARRYAGQRLDGILTTDEQFGPVAAALIGERLGLPALGLDAVLHAQHKYFARCRHRQVVPEATPAFGLVDRESLARGEVPLPFPFYIKPIKAAFSVLARRVDDLDGVRRHVNFGWWEDAIIRRLVKPFNDATGDLMRRRHGRFIDAYTMIAESLITGHQVTCNGYAEGDAVRMLATVDSIMYPGTDQFMRFQYPSRLPVSVLRRMDEIATRVVRGIGLTHGMFNIEMMWDPATDAIQVIELNPRVAGQFFDLIEKVDGYSLFEAALALACGKTPLIRERAGHMAHAASFVLRDFTDRGLAYVPGPRELAALRAAHPDAHIQVYVKTGNGLARELKWLGSYRYCVMNIAGASLEDMFARFIRVRDAIGFHPRDYALRFTADSIADLIRAHLTLELPLSHET